MKLPSFALCLALLLGLSALIHPLRAQDDDAGTPLIDVTSASVLQYFEATDEGQVSWAASTSSPGIVVEIQPGEAGYPGVVINPPSSSWDLSQAGHISAKITNMGEAETMVALRADNSGGGPEPWNAEQIYLKPGETKSIKLIFGHSYGHKPAYKLDSSRVVKLLLFTGKAKKPISFRIESLTYGGQPGEKPPVNPASVRTAPEEGGLLLGQGGVELANFKVEGDAESKLVEPGSWEIHFPGPGRKPFSILRPQKGEWDFREGLQASFKIRNTGYTEVTPAIQMVSRDKKTAKVTAAQPLVPNAEMTLVVPFYSEEPWTAANPKNSGSQFLNNHGTGIVASLAGENAAEEEAFLEISEIRIGLPPRDFPEWLGKRPPVDTGEWVITLDDNFDGTEVDQKVWSYYGENYWDKTTRFSKKNTFVKDGTVTLRMTKERGPHNDDPSHKLGERDYTTGFLESYGKFTQKYGYFEARMKLTKSPGVWPAFWLMPDRGEEVGPQWKRADTKNGGMEFDIMEQLSGWGIYRYNVAMHWDGYDKEHKSIGTTSIYAQPDEEGFITAGLLWLPGQAIFYANGKEVARNETERISNVQSNILFTLPMGGWDNLPMDDAQLPADFVIDYVRVWQRKDLMEQ